MTTIDLDGIVFRDFATSGWVFSDLVDWQGLTDDKVPVNERPQGHGAFATSRSLRTSRAISFTATYLAESESELEDAVDALAAVGADGPVRVEVQTDRGVTWRTVTVQASKLSDPKGAAEGAVAVDMIARDPLRYADADWDETGPPVPGSGLVWPVVWPAVWPGGGSDGRVTLTNSGRAPSAPVFQLVGGFDSATITCVETGARIGFDRMVPVGSVVEIDAGTYRATIDGQSDVSRFLRWREWELVPGLSARSFQFDPVGASGAPVLRGRVFPAWW